jgi:hypothetical protein
MCFSSSVPALRWEMCLLNSILTCYIDVSSASYNSHLGIEYQGYISGSNLPYGYQKYFVTLLFSPCVLGVQG